MSRALRRHHRARVIANRVAEARRVESASWRQPLLWPEQWPVGRHAHSQAVLGCGRPRCGICHPSKRWHAGADRMRAKREWAPRLGDRLGVRPIAA